MTPDTPTQSPKTGFNLIIAGLLTLLAAWITWADFSYPGDLLFQSSPSVIVTAIITSLLFLLCIPLAALPKRIIVSVNLLILSRVSLGFPLNIAFDTTLAIRIVDAALLLTSTFYLHRAFSAAPWITARPWFHINHTLTTIGAGIVVGLLTLPFSLIGYIYGAQNLLGDYVSFSFKGIYLTERVFQKDNRKVHLVGMMHIGDDSYYTHLKERINATPPAGGKRLVLTEGVADREKLIPEDFANGKTYERWANLLGIAVQKDLQATTQNTRPLQTTSEPQQDPHNPLVTWKNADIDVSDLQPHHLQLLLKLLEAASSADIQKILSPDLGNITGTQFESLFKDALIGTRNQTLMDHYNQSSAGFQEIYIPWGAAHLPDMEKRFLAQGYQPTEEIIRPIIKFWK